MERKVRRATTAETIRVYQALGAVLQRLPDGTYRYTDDANDAAIAARCGVAETSVAHVRKAMFGHLRAAPPEDTSVEYLARTVATLARRLDDLEAAVRGDRLI